MLWIKGILSYFLTSRLVAPHQAHFQLEAPRLKSVLDDEFEAWLNETGYKWGMKGVAIAVTRQIKGDNWHTELKGYGVADRWGNPVDEEVRLLIMMSLSCLNLTFSLHYSSLDFI